VRRQRGRKERRHLVSALAVSAILAACYAAAGLWYGGRHLWPQAVIFGAFALNQVAASFGVPLAGWGPVAHPHLKGPR
jgi:hypothetical protein